ncbi:hypothetical protein QQF64_004190 [Cirrhinus molitorella]|uniref:Uncharacterized protein n=1 Tax=Cirrhinus molitorella TaxID=172907 RepID=A0ABR3MFU8_9TELE
MGAIHQALYQNIDETRDVVLHCLVNYLGEKEEDLIQEYNCDNEDLQQSLLQHILKIAVCKRDGQEDLFWRVCKSWLAWEICLDPAQFFLESHMH